MFHEQSAFLKYKGWARPFPDLFLVFIFKWKWIMLIALYVYSRCLFLSKVRARPFWPKNFHPCWDSSYIFQYKGHYSLIHFFKWREGAAFGLF